MDDAVDWYRQVPSVQRREVNGVAGQCFGQRDLLRDDEIVPVSCEDVVRLLVDYEDQVRGDHVGLLVSFLRECDFRSLFPPGFDLDREDFFHW